MKSHTLPLLVAMILVAPASFASTYQFQQPAQGMVSPIKPPSSIGNGISTDGACAIGAATGCSTWNPNDKGALMILSSDKLTVSNPGSWTSLRATTGKPTGKWYWELTTAGSPNIIVGIAAADMATGSEIGVTYSSYGFNRGNPNRLRWSGATANPFTAAVDFNPGHVVSFALDMDNKQLHVAIDGVWQANANFGVVVSGLSGTVFPALQSTGGGATANFGQTNFHYPVPAGYNAGLW